MLVRRNMIVSLRSIKMPTMLRIPGKAKKIAAKILGFEVKKARKSKNHEHSKINKRLLFEETVRVR